MKGYQMLGELLSKIGGLELLEFLDSNALYKNIPGLKANKNSRRDTIISRRAFEEHQTLFF